MSHESDQAPLEQNTLYDAVQDIGAAALHQGIAAQTVTFYREQQALHVAAGLLEEPQVDVVAYGRVWPRPNDGEHWLDLGRGNPGQDEVMNWLRRSSSTTAE